MSVPLCANCGRPERDHCKFEAKQMPQGCVCDVETWIFLEVADICDNYDPGDTDNRYCVKCEHD